MKPYFRLRSVFRLVRGAHRGYFLVLWAFLGLSYKKRKKTVKFVGQKTALIERFRRGQTPFSAQETVFRLVRALRRWSFLSFFCCPKHFQVVWASSSLLSGLFWASLCVFARYGYHKATDLRQRSRFLARWMSANDESSVGTTFSYRCYDHPWCGARTE